MADAGSGVQSVGVDLEERARRASVDVEAKRKVLEAAIELRDKLIVELYDHGLGVRRIAATMKMSASRVIQVVSRRG